jgi:hypothetical protein
MLRTADTLTSKMIRVGKRVCLYLGDLRGLTGNWWA